MPKSREMVSNRADIPRSLSSDRDSSKSSRHFGPIHLLLFNSSSSVFEITYCVEPVAGMCVYQPALALLYIGCRRGTQKQSSSSSRKWLQQIWL